MSQVVYTGLCVIECHFQNLKNVRRKSGKLLEKTRHFLTRLWWRQLRRKRKWMDRVVKRWRHCHVGGRRQLREHRGVRDLIQWKNQLWKRTQVWRKLCHYIYHKLLYFWLFKLNLINFIAFSFCKQMGNYWRTARAQLLRIWKRQTQAKTERWYGRVNDLNSISIASLFYTRYMYVSFYMTWLYYSISLRPWYFLYQTLYVHLLT